MVMRYTRRVLVAVDQLGNTLMGGEPDETISYRAAKLRLKGVVYGWVMCRFLDLFQKGHCDITLANNDKQRIPGS